MIWIVGAVVAVGLLGTLFGADKGMFVGLALVVAGLAAGVMVGLQ